MTDRPGDIPMRILRDHLSDVSDEVSRGRRFVVTRNNKARMALVPIEDLQRLRDLEDADDLAVYRARANEPTIPWEVVKASLGL
jgi:antitoxin (DNA-binding transcriptional repressor) of toxin-antitoxin stability system